MGKEEAQTNRTSTKPGLAPAASTEAPPDLPRFVGPAITTRACRPKQALVMACGDYFPSAMRLRNAAIGKSGGVGLNSFASFCSP